MKYLDLTLPTPEENLALDEALLELCEEGLGEETLRIWEPKSYFVVLGFSRKFRSEVHEKTCRKYQIPILRRPSGGGTVLQGPGCLNYALILNQKRSKSLTNIVKTNQYILSRHQKALAALLKNQNVSIKGISDLTIWNLKFSGNAQRKKKTFVLYHGTFLLNFDFKLMEKILKIPQHQPDYRNSRKHTDFLTNLPASSQKIKKSLIKIWGAESKLSTIPRGKIKELIEKRYSKDEWNYKF